ncbi:hypothetical protein EC991_003826 [Linnemannia zychae]|nr:hypothetical protein EC991_003826 [Linnemannia zychae]
MKVKKILSRRSLTKQEDKDQRRRRSNRMKSLPDEDAGVVFWEQDVLSCTLVSHKWHEICNSILWNDVSIYWYTSERPLLRSFTATGSLKKYGHHIQILEMEYGDECMQNFLSLAPEIFSQLQSIELNGDVAESDGMVADLLWRCSQRHGGVGLRQFVMECGEFGEYGMYFCFGSKSFEALMDHVSTLEVFRVEAPCSSSKEIQQLLCSAPRLRVFNILSVDRRRPIEHGTWLDASDVHTDWACTSLKVFGCPIGGVPRPDIKRKLHNRDASDFVLEGNQQESITLQKQVYRQLARLTDLRELRMGIPYYTEDPSYRRFDKEFDRQYDCLSMSLESGLDLLSGLKGLRVVALEDMEVAIDDKRETRWVAQNWPRAEVLSTDCGSDRDEDSQLSGDDERDSYDELSYGWQEDYDNDNY